MILQLPVEVLTTIFGYLPLADRKACRLTCKLFYEICTTYSLIKDETLHIDVRYLKSPAHIASWSETDRSLYRAMISDLNTFGCYWLFYKYGKTLKTLIFNRLNIDVDDFSHILKYLTNMDNLSLINCDSLLIEGKDFSSGCSDANPSLRNLKQLEISSTKYLTDNSLCAFISLFPNISHLSIKNTSISCHRGTSNFYYRDNPDFMKNPSKNVLTVQYLIALLELKCKNLQSLNLSRTIINNEALTAILKINSLKLCRLNVSYCHELRESDMIAMGNWQPTLTELRISGCDMVTNEFLEHLSKKLINLKILCISYSSNIDDEGLEHLKNLVKIVVLDISNCGSISSLAIRNLLSTNSLSKSIKTLVMNNTLIEDSDLAYLCEILNLTELSISYCKKLSDECLPNLFANQKLLTKLGIAGLNISDEGCTGFEDPPSVNGLFDDDERENVMRELEDYFESLLDPPAPSLENLKCLVCLDLSKSKQITDFTLIRVRTLRNLRELYMAGLEHVSSYSLSYLTLSSPGLEILNVSGCNITDFGVLLISRNLHRLKNLNLRNCKKISDEALFFILINCKELQELNVLGCFGLNRLVIENVKRLPNMRKVISSFRD